MTFPDHFSTQAALYAAARPQYPAELFGFLASVAPATGSVWDCGTGNGQAALGLAQHFGRVYASDPSRRQIEHAVNTPGVSYSVQTAEAVGFADAAFDAVCVAQALHWFDLDRFYPEVQRVLQPGGIIAAWGYAWLSVTPAFDHAFQRSILDEISRDWAPQNRLLWHAYREIPFPFTPITTPTSPSARPGTCTSYWPTCAPGRQPSAASNAAAAHSLNRPQRDLPMCGGRPRRFGKSVCRSICGLGGYDIVDTIPHAE
jgi:SAM-dependent methyltransferase